VSVLQITRAWAAPCASASEKLVLLALADRADDGGVAWPSMATMATRCGLSAKQVRRHIRALVHRGLIGVLSGGKGGRATTPKYKLLLQNPPTGGSLSGASIGKETLPPMSLNPPMDVPKPSHGWEPIHQEPSLTVRKKPRTKHSPKSQTLETWLAETKSAGLKAIDPSDAIFRYADDAGIEGDWIEACWIEFKSRYGDGGSKASNLQRDWRAHFRNAVRGNW